jgi:hypothetical protein
MMNTHPARDIDVRVLHPQFNSLEADLTLLSSEGTAYRVPSFTLRSTCGYFRILLIGYTPICGSAEHTQSKDAEELNLPIEVDEKDKVITKVLSMVCGLYITNWESIDEVEDVLSLAEKWDAPGPLSMIRGAITAPMFLADPLRLYAITTRFGWEEETRLASTHTLTLDLYDETHRPVLERISSSALMTLLRFHRLRRNEFKRLIDSISGLFEEGNSVEYFCSKCRKMVNNHTWRELKVRMFMELDKRPLGDTLCSLEMEEWPEAVLCWESKCKNPDCGELNYDKLSTLRDIKKCIDRLPLNV